MGIRLKHHGKVVAACSIAKYIHQYMGTIENLKYQNLYNPKNGRLKVTITTRISNCLGSQKPPSKAPKLPRKQYLAAGRQARPAKYRAPGKLSFLGGWLPRIINLAA
jgi:hypothetical protein